MRILSKLQILEAKDLIFRDVSTPEWAPDGTPEEERAQFGVRIRNLTAEGRGVFVKKTLERKAQDAVEAAAKEAGLPSPIKESEKKFEGEIILVAMSACDESGNLLFTEDDVRALGHKNAAAVMRCGRVAQELSGLSEEAKAETVKNSEPAQS